MLKKKDATSKKRVKSKLKTAKSKCKKKSKHASTGVESFGRNKTGRTDEATRSLYRRNRKKKRRSRSCSAEGERRTSRSRQRRRQRYDEDGGISSPPLRRSRAFSIERGSRKKTARKRVSKRRFASGAARTGGRLRRGASAWESEGTTSDSDFDSSSDADSTGWLRSTDEIQSLSFSASGSKHNQRTDHRRSNAKIKRPHITTSIPLTSSNASSPMHRVLHDQKQSNMIAEAAIRDASRLRSQVSTVEKRFAGVSAQLKECLEREQALKMARGRDKLAAKELRYRNLYLAKELAQVKDAAKEAAALTRAKMNGMANSLNNLEEGTASRARAVQREVRHLRGLLTSLQRRAVRGVGPAGSASGERILTAMWQSVENILQLGVPGGVPAQSHVSSRRPYFSEEANSKKGSAVSNENETIKATRDLAETMDGVVGDLERENQRLRAEVEMLQTEIVHYKGKTESVALIPQYRQAVTRAREHAELLRQRLREEIDAKVRIEEELAKAQKEVRHLTERTASQIRKSVENEKELAATHLRSAYLNQTVDLTKEQFRAAYADFASTTSQQQQVIEELQEVVAAQRKRLEELSGVEFAHFNNNNHKVEQKAVHKVNVHVPKPDGQKSNTQAQDFGTRPPQINVDEYPGGAESPLLSGSSDEILASDEDVEGGNGDGSSERSLYEAIDAGVAMAPNNEDNVAPVNDDGSNALATLHHDLAKLDAEIAVLQSGILEATRRQHSSATPTH